MSSAAALVLTLLFVPDPSVDPSVPSVVLDIVEDARERRADVFVLPPRSPSPGSTLATGNPRVLHLASPSMGTPLALRSLPLAPEGASVVDVMDGVVVTIDDLGVWLPAPPPAAESSHLPLAAGVESLHRRVAPASAREPVPSLETPPAAERTTDNGEAPLPVASSSSLRVLVPTIVPGEAVPATLHARRGAGSVSFAGHAVVLTRRQPTTALGVGQEAKAHRGFRADASVPVFLDGRITDSCVSSSPSSASPSVTRAFQRKTQGRSFRVVCSTALAVGLGEGTRLASTPALDGDAVVVVVDAR
jgi:hypothetical protein